VVFFWPKIGHFEFDKKWQRAGAKKNAGQNISTTQ
jgi:hypothetical protein